ncbi:DUF397 domain-containing protein [Saccharopolyspora hattusasensis]|uniref:DUF397 domain-containing protein n=1 Tax=Saccharopolyspora hattusasensis TaxID=1128679 RepID=UPI003D971681
MSTDRWMKSSYSQSNGACVELTTPLDRIRDSKDPDGPILKVDVSAFVQAVRAGRFDR